MGTTQLTWVGVHCVVDVLVTMEWQIRNESLSTVNGMWWRSKSELNSDTPNRGEEVQTVTLGAHLLAA